MCLVPALCACVCADTWLTSPQMNEHPFEDDAVKNGRVKGFLEPSRGIGDGRCGTAAASGCAHSGPHPPQVQDQRFQREGRPAPRQLAPALHDRYASAGVRAMRGHSRGRSAEPEVSFHQLADDDAYLVLATDGLWATTENDDVAQFIESHERALRLRLTPGWFDYAKGARSLRPDLAHMLRPMRS